jgi:ATP-binding cassette subfamily F protein 3
MIHFSNITKQYGQRILYKTSSFQINPGEKMGLVGANGSGKTTIFRIITGEEGFDEGTLTRPEKLTVGYFSQDIGEMSGRSALDEVKSANPRIPVIHSRLKELEAELCKELKEDIMTRTLEEYGEIQSEFDHLGGYTVDARAAEILTGLGIGPDSYNRPTETFSGGWKMRIALAKILMLQPDVLLMDEPTNHLDLESIVWLEEWLGQFSGSVLMTSHDRDFMNRLVTKIVEVAHQRITVYSGNYDFYEKERDIRKEQLIASARRQDEMLAKEKEFIARFAARASHAAQVQSRVKKIEKIDLIEVPSEVKSIKFDWPTPPRGGDEVLRFENLRKSWTNPEGQEKLVFSGITGLIKRLDRVAIIGVNGAGKSTFMKVVTNQTPASGGVYQIGANVEIGYFSQNSLDVLNSENTITEEIQERIPEAGIGYIRNLLGAFRFSGTDADKKIRILSGGEKSRVVLATILARPVNFLVLDEPTNHLDIDSRETLLEAIKNFPGTVMIVSHDRHFLRAVTTRVFEISDQHLTIHERPYQ